jgi:hypothetical protein
VGLGPKDKSLLLVLCGLMYLKISPCQIYVSFVLVRLNVRKPLVCCSLRCSLGLLF